MFLKKRKRLSREKGALPVQRHIAEIDVYWLDGTMTAVLRRKLPQERIFAFVAAHDPRRQSVLKAPSHILELID